MKTTCVLDKDIKIKTRGEKQRWTRRRMPLDINNLLLYNLLLDINNLQINVESSRRMYYTSDNQLLYYLRRPEGAGLKRRHTRKFFGQLICSFSKRTENIVIYSFAVVLTQVFNRFPTVSS